VFTFQIFFYPSRQLIHTHDMSLLGFCAPSGYKLCGCTSTNLLPTKTVSKSSSWSLGRWQPVRCRFEVNRLSLIPEYEPMSYARVHSHPRHNLNRWRWPEDQGQPLMWTLPILGFRQWINSLYWPCPHSSRETIGKKAIEFDSWSDCINAPSPIASGSMKVLLLEKLLAPSHCPRNK